MNKKIILFASLVILIILGSFVYFYFLNNTNIKYENEFNKLTPEERDSIRTQDIKQLEIALEFYYEDKGEYPITNNIEKIINDKNSLVNALSPKYLIYNQHTYNNFPLDPLTPESFYTYESDGNSYNLIVNSETKGIIRADKGTGLNTTLPESSFDVDFTDYYFSVDAYNANLTELFEEITLKTGVEIKGNIPQDYTISIKFDKKGFTRGMNEIVDKIKPGEYEGDFQLGQIFSESIYYIRKRPRESLQQKTDSAEYYNLKGERLLAENKLDEAHHSFISALISDPRYLPAHKNLILVYGKQEKYYGMIEKKAQEIISLEPSNAENYKILADAYRLNCQYGNSLKNYVISFDMINSGKFKKEIISSIKTIKSESWKKDCPKLQK
jgi:hypothetical protein